MFYIYKLGTTKPIPREEIINLLDRQLNINDELIDCGENTVIKLYPSNRNGFVYIVLLLALNVSHKQIFWNSNVLGKFYQLCQKHQMLMKSLRNNYLLTPSDGAFFSDLIYSKAYRQARHKADNPKDVK